MQKHRVATVLLLLVGVLAAAAAGTAPASAAPPKVRQSDWKELIVHGGGKASAVRGPDSQAHAKLTGLPNSEAAGNLSAQVRFEDLASTISEKNQGLVSMYGFDDDHQPWIAMTHKPSREIIQQLLQLPSTTTVKYGASASFSELTETQMRVADELEKIDRVQKSTGGIDARMLTVWVKYELKPGSSKLTSGEVNEILSTVAARSTDGLLPAPITFRSGNIDIKPQVAVVGGSNLDPTDPDIGGCTAGFSVRKGSQDGLVTARHCYNYMKYNGATGIIAYNSATAPSQQRDLQWHKTINGNTASPRIKTGTRAGDPVLRTITGSGNPGDNATVCHYGRGTGYTRCGTVTNPSTYYYDGTQRYAGIVEVAPNICTGGDSGGPWFADNSARGVHSAGSGSNCYFTWISSIVYLDLSMKYG